MLFTTIILSQHIISVNIFSLFFSKKETGTYV